MHHKILTSLFAAALCAGAARAQNSSATASSVATPSTPAPAVAAAPAAGNEAALPAMPAPTQIVYTPKLPAVAELTNAASAQGLTVERVVQTSNQVIAFYRAANGQTSTVAYQALPPVGTAPAPTVAPAPATVVYQTAPRAVYYDDYYAGPYYSSRVWYPPISLSFGFGYRGGFYRGGYRHWR